MASRKTPSKITYSEPKSYFSPSMKAAYKKATAAKKASKPKK